METDRTHQPYEVDGLGRAAALAAVRDAEVQARMAERRKLRLAVQWCALHPGTADDHAGQADVEDPTWDLPDLHIAGEGTPWVAAGAPEAFAAALGVSATAGHATLADVLDLTHRLRRIWAGVDALDIPAWKARKVARMTRELPVDAVSWVDEDLAPKLEKGLGFVTIERTVLAAIAAFCPELLAERERQGRAAWHVDLEHRRGEGWDGSSVLDALGDTGDLTDFHELVCAVAERLAESGDTDTVGQRRAKALGMIGRGEHVALLDGASATEAGAASAAGDAVRTGGGGVVALAEPAARTRAASRRVPRRLYVHMSFDDLAAAAVAARDGAPDDLAGPDPAGGGSVPASSVAAVEVERFGAATAALVQQWLGGRVPLRVTPVVDLAERRGVDRHDPPPWMREAVVLRDRHCVHPYCEVDSRECDLDHIEPYRPHGPPGQTCPENLAPLCRRAHVAKTHLGWRYVRNTDGSYTWTDPQGHQYLVTSAGTLPIG